MVKLRRGLIRGLAALIPALLLSLFLQASPASAATVCASVSGAKACLQTYGDHIYLYDTAADSAHPEVYFVLENAGYAVAWGWCRQTGGANTVADCNFNFPESSTVHFVAARVDGNTLKDYSGVKSGYAGAARVAPSDLQDYSEVPAEEAEAPIDDGATAVPADPGSIVTGGSMAIGAEQDPEDVVAELQANSRALSLQEVQDRGLSQYVDSARYEMAEPMAVSATSGTPTPTPAQAPADTVTALASTCWEVSYYGGRKGGLMTLFGQTDVTWCGDGKWVTYSAHGCWGDETYAFYRYEGCTTIDDFGHPKPGEYWNVYDVWSQYQLCPMWFTKAGGCFWVDRPQNKYRFGSSGQIWYISSNY